MWHSCKEIDIGRDYTSTFCKPLLLSRANNQLGQQLDHYINNNKLVPYAFENELGSIIHSQMYSGREHLKRPLLSRMSVKSQINDQSKLRRESNIRRNTLVLEDVVRGRARENWLDEQTTILH